ncbi:tyrosine-type recombinase/integrase [Halosimplex halophilum]|uniref:tyrosine-type recombinase/integrase n=1 Tax=Halosimplex halophilum TaxID=2559572 RepID=UPI00107FAD61|nr:tyrosine-type recombinase/integrase [Halosimplex halophilum]
MAQGPVKKLRSERDRIERYGTDGTLPEETTKALLEWSAALHPEETAVQYVSPDGEATTFAIGTVETYLREMRKVAERAISNLLELDPKRFNAEIDAMHSGENPNVKSDGLAKRTLTVTQSAARTFVWYFDIADPEAIRIYNAPAESSHDESDVFTRDDIQALRAHVDGPRNRALLEMLLHTGQRISAIQGLRIKDIDTDNGWFSLNTDRGALKGADARGQRRPLLGAQQYLSERLDVHPLADDPDAYVFVGDPSHHYTNLDEPLCQGTIRRMLETTADLAGVDKPVNPHSFRHFWTTTMKQHYGLNDEELKMLLGHKREWNGLNRVYNHATDETVRENALRKLGEQDGRIAKPLTPDQCDNCDETLESHWTHCPVCGVAYGP